MRPIVSNGRPVSTVSSSARIAARTSGSARRGDQLGERAGLVHQPLEGRALEERVPGAQPEQHAERAVGDLGPQHGAVGLGRDAGVQQLAPEVGCRVGLEHEERHREAELGGEPPHPVDLLDGRLGVLAVGARLGELEHGAPAGGGDAGGDAEQLVLGGVGAGDGVAGAGGVAGDAGGREPDGAGLDRLLHDGGHLGDLAPRWPARSRGPSRP